MLVKKILSHKSKNSDIKNVNRLITAHLGGLHVCEDGLLVVCPVAGQRVGGGELAAGVLDRDVHAVGEVVVEILHLKSRTRPPYTTQLELKTNVSEV